MGHKSERTNEAIARWQSRRGKYWLELYDDAALGGGYSFSCENGGGSLGYVTRAEAMELMCKRAGDYAADGIRLTRAA